MLVNWFLFAQGGFFSLVSPTLALSKRVNAVLLSHSSSQVRHLKKLKVPMHQITVLKLLFITVQFVLSFQWQNVKAFLSCYLQLSASAGIWYAVPALLWGELWNAWDEGCRHWLTLLLKLRFPPHCLPHQTAKAWSILWLSGTFLHISITLLLSSE